MNASQTPGLMHVLLHVVRCATIRSVYHRVGSKHPCSTSSSLQDRIHRLGQYKPITVTRFVIAGTIEERILKLQEKKRLVFEGTVGRDAEALGKLTVDDLRFLFG